MRHDRAPARREFAILNDEDSRKIALVAPSNAAKANRAMNRYSNVTPYDRNRVALRQPINGSDYVNASWVRGPAGGGGADQCSFIAAQGPMPNNVRHFLQMIAENEAEIVVMLTKTEEADGNGGLYSNC